MTSVEAPSPSRSPWQRLYEAGHRWRYRWYQKRARRLPCPVVSVGNLHWGGTGKTPLVAALAGRLRDRGLRVAILSRGYRRQGEGIMLVSTGDGPLLGPLVAGDEPVLLAGEVPGVAVVVGEDRYLAGRHALQRLDPPPQLFVLDDGFSHLRLARDLDLLVLPVADPFGGGRLPPSGRLREPLASSARADAVLVSGGAETAEEVGPELARALRPYGFRGAGFTVHTRIGAARLDPQHQLPATARVLLVSAIARPERFRAAVDETELRILDELRFPDHHAYPEKTLEQLRSRFDELGAEAVLTTSKDRVKLHGRLDRPLAELPLRAEPGDAFWSWLDERLGEILEP